MSMDDKTRVVAMYALQDSSEEWLLQVETHQAVLVSVAELQQHIFKFM